MYINNNILFDSINIEEKSFDKFRVKLFISENLPYFDGHFDNFKLLPAVAQIKITADISKKIFDKDFTVNKLLKVKFINMILQNTTVYIDGNYSNNILSFKISDEEKKYSEGKIYFN